MLDEHKHVEYTKDGNFQTSPPLESNLFIMSLFTRVSDHGIPYSKPCNHRHPVNSNLLSREKHKLSLVDQVTQGDETVFSGNSVSIMFYQEKSFVALDERNFEGCILTSIARETLKVGNLETKDVKIKFRKTAVFPTQNQLLKLAYIMNIKVGAPAGKEKKPTKVGLCIHTY